MNDFHALLARIHAGLERGLIDQRVAAHYVGAHLCRRLFCSRVALWTIRDAPGRAALTRIGGFDALANRPLAEVVALEVETSSAWLVEVLGRGGYLSNDAATDQRLNPLREACLAPARIGAIAQAAIHSKGRVCGFVSCEQAGSARAWTREDAELLRRVADAISQQRARRLQPAPA